MAGGGAAGVQAARPAAKPVVSLAKNGEAAQLVRAAVDALGGIGSFIQPGQVVCIKPNASWDRSPGIGATTHPDVMAEVVKLCLEAQAREVYAIDYPLAPDPFFVNGLRDAVTDAGGKFVVLSADNNLFQELDFVEGMRALPTMRVRERVAVDVIEADVVVNVPVLKHHSSAGLAISLKNLMGVILDRGRYHGGGSGNITSPTGIVSNVLQQSIADLGLLLKDKVKLNIVDATYVMRSRSGPQGLDDVEGDKDMTIIAGADMVAVDTRAAMVWGMTEEQIRREAGHIPLAAEIGVGTFDVANVELKEVDVQATAVASASSPALS